MPSLSDAQQKMVALFQRPVGAELAGDLETTMATMSDHPRLNHVPTMAGGVGRGGVHVVYRYHLTGKFFPPDVEMKNLDPAGLPVTGVESARKVLDPGLPARAMTA